MTGYVETGSDSARAYHQQLIGMCLGFSKIHSYLSLDENVKMFRKKPFAFLLMIPHILYRCKRNFVHHELAVASIDN